jgi:hypothetical protein
MSRAAAVCLILACACPGFARAQQARPQVPLRKTVADQGCNASTLPAAVASALVASVAVLHDGDDCVVAFVRDLEREGTPLEVISSGAMSQTWNYATVALVDGDLSPVEDILKEGGVLLVNLRYTIDDNAIPILTSSLEHIGTIYGTFVRTWPNGLIQYDSHQPHFGPHDVQISVFDPKTKADREICRGLSCWSEAEQLVPTYFDWATNTLAFALELLYQHADVGAWDQRARIMATCEGLAKIDSIECRETPLEQWQAARADLDLAQLVRFAASQPRFR